MSKELGNSVWGEEIHTDHNGVSVTHQLFVDPEKEGDEPEKLPAGHFYDVIAGDSITPIHFQSGPVKEYGVNGVTNEALMAIVIHRLRVLNEAFPCRENSLAITNFEQGLMWLEHRTRDRQKRGVEGFNKA